MSTRYSPVMNLINPKERIKELAVPKFKESPKLTLDPPPETPGQVHVHCQKCGKLLGVIRWWSSGIQMLACLNEDCDRFRNPISYNPKTKPADPAPANEEHNDLI
jgi:hypothetical protein